MHPVGPRSAGVYWFRRALLAAVAVIVVVGVVWFVVGRARGPQVDPAADSTTTSGSNQMTGVLATSSVSGYGDGKSGQAGSRSGAGHSTAAGTKAAGTKAAGTTATGTKATGTKATGTKATGAKATGSKGTGGKATGTKATGAKATGSKGAGGKATGTKTAGTTATGTKATGTKATGSPTPRTTPTTPPRTTPTTTPPPPPSYDEQGRLLCADSAIALKATTGAPSYPAGSQPILGLIVTNTSNQACVRDLSGSLQVYTVFSASGTRMWSTADCFPGEGTDVRQLAAGQAVTYNIKWSGTTSNPGCTAERTPVPAGTYQVVAQLGALKSPATPFTITG
jgi:hypothetical protein